MNNTNVLLIYIYCLIIVGKRMKNSKTKELNEIIFNVKNVFLNELLVLMSIVIKNGIFVCSIYYIIS